MRAVFFFLGVIIILGCENLNPDTPVIFYNVDSLVNAQVNYLMEQRPEVVKTGDVKDDAGESVIIPDSLQWTRELAIFKRADINKPSYWDQYTRTYGFDEDSEWMTYRAEGEKNLPVRYLTVRYDEDPTKIIELEALIRDTNPLYKSERLIRMNFIQQNNTSVLTSYYIQGGQKMKLRDTVVFDLNAKVRYR